MHGRETPDRPAVRVGDVVIFPDGRSRKLTRDEHRRLRAGETVTVDPRSGERTRLVGDWTHARPL